METDKVAELKSCPFCGGEAELGGWETSWYIRCKTDECFAETYAALFMEMAEAITAWNTRASAEARSAGRGGVGEDALRERLETIGQYAMDMAGKYHSDLRCTAIASLASEVLAALSPQPTATEETAP